MQELRLQLLGAPQISLGGAPLNIARRKAVALLCYLAITGTPHTREALAALLAGEQSDVQARKSLRNTLAALRDLEGGYLQITRQTVAFNRTGHYWLDVEIIQAILNTARPDSDPRLLRAAVDLYQGELLAGFSVRDAPAFDEWLLAQREQLHESVVRALDSLVTHYTLRGEYADGIACATRLLALEPWREEAHRQLMLLLARSGQRSAALAQYETCQRILGEELGVAPAGETVALYERLCAAAAPPPHNLPPPPTAFVGRTQELANLAQWLADPACRLITIVGLGGSGKTRLAIQAARRYVTSEMLIGEQIFPDGVFLVELARIDQVVANSGEAGNVHRLATAIGDALSISFRGGTDPARQLRAFLNPKALLLVLDNAEHLLEGEGAALTLLTDILQGAPRVKLLATSQKRLHLEEEWGLQLGGLELPDDPSTIEQTDAGALFLQQAQRALARFVPDAADRVQIVQICRLVEGLPLALALAASWLRGVSCAEVAAELAQGLDLLSSSVRNLPARHRSIRAVFAASWQRLSDAEQAVLRHLSVFQGGFHRAAAEVVAGATLPQLLALIDASLVSRNEAGRYAIHELVRQYAAEQLAAQPDAAVQVNERHAAYYAAFVQQHAAALHQTRQARDAIHTEIANVRIAWDWAVRRARVDLLEQLRTGLAVFYDLMGLFQEGAATFEHAAAAVRAAPVNADAPASRITLGYLLAEHAHWLIRLAQFTRSRPLLEEALALAEDARSPALEARSAHELGELYQQQSDYAVAQSYLERALTLAHTARLSDIEARCLRTCGQIAAEQGAYAQAIVHYKRAVVCYRELGDRLGEGQIYGYLGNIASDQARFAQARTYYEHHLRICREVGDRPWEMIALIFLGALKEDLGYYSEAGAQFEQALCIAQELGDHHNEGVALTRLGQNALYQGDFWQAQAYYDQALQIHREISYRAGEGYVLADLGQLAHYLGNDAHARDLSQQALQIAHETGNLRRQRFALMVLGHALAGLGRLEEAAESYRRALALVRLVGYHQLATEAIAGLARVALAQGDLPQAMAHVERILDYLHNNTLDGTEEPLRTMLTCFRVLQAAGDPRVAPVLADSQRLLQQRAAGIANNDRRQMFLANIPAHRELLRLWQARRKLPA